MKLALVLLALVGLVAAGTIHTNREVKVADKEFLARQKFLFEIVHRVEDPLMFEEWIQKAKFIVDKSHYTQFDIYMEKFWEAYKLGALLPRGEFFGALAKTHHKQALGLFNFFYYAKDWETFVSNVCWARIHVNEGMFVQALTLAVIHRDDFQGLILPTIYEIFPQHFLNSKLVYQAEKFDYDVWSKLIMYEKEYKDILYKDVKDIDTDSHLFTHDWKVWQWWKMMGLGEHWYTGDKFFLRENLDEVNKNPKYYDIIKEHQIFWMPVDYTRDIDIYNEHSKLSYFTEDLGWNSYWYYLNMDYAFFLDGKTFGLNKDRRGEYWIYNVQQILARYYLERLSNGLGEIPQFSWHREYDTGYDPQLISYSGVGFSYRKNYYEIHDYANYDMLNLITNYYRRIHDIVDTGYYRTKDGTVVDLRKPESIEIIGSLLQGNIDTFDQFFFKQWTLLSHMYLSEVDYDDTEVFPNVFINYETMLRDPLFYSFYKKIVDVFYHFKYQLPAYTREELVLPGVKITNVEVSKLVTYHDLVDFDVTNLLNDKLTFVDGQLVWDKSLAARQLRLNHKPFTYDIEIESDRPQKVVIRTFLGPKYDEFGRTISLVENRKNFYEIDEFVYDLVNGKNVVKRNSKDFDWTIDDRITYTELYKFVLTAYEGKYNFPLELSEPHCGFPDRLILPHGWVKGLPVQLYFFVTPYTSTKTQYETYDNRYSCGIGSGVRHIDDLPFGYPFDRTIDEYQFYVPNGYFKDVEIYHEERLTKYLNKKYQRLGTFDQNF